MRSRRIPGAGRLPMDDQTSLFGGWSDDDCGELREQIARLDWKVSALEAENLRLLDDPGANRVGKFPRQSQESRLAALRVMPQTGTKRAAVLDLLSRLYPRGLSDEQIQRRIGGDIRSINARRKELEEGGWVIKADWKWHAPSGNDVCVWILSPTAAEALVGFA